MIYYSRLTDIVNIGIDDLLAESNDRPSAIVKIIAEIEEGLTGARRSVAGATRQLEGLKAQLAERKAQAEEWGHRARSELAAGNEAAAREALMRKREAMDLASALEPNMAAAASTLEHLTTTMRAVEARLAEARRRQTELSQIASEAASRPRKKADSTYGRASDSGSIDPRRIQSIEDELAALKHELGRSPLL